MMESYQWELYDWAVEQESDAPSAELDYVEEASAAGGSSKLTIPGAGRESEKELTWYFSITATNWLGGVGWTSIQVGGPAKDLVSRWMWVTDWLRSSSYSKEPDDTSSSPIPTMHQGLH